MNELGRLQNTSTLKYVLLYYPPIFLKGLKEFGKTLIITMDEQAERLRYILQILGNGMEKSE
jgi:hypothetical protein